MTRGLCQSGVLLSSGHCPDCDIALRKRDNKRSITNKNKTEIMINCIQKPGRAASMPASFLLISLFVPTQLLAQDEQATSPGFEETHALIEELIVDKLILQNHWHQSDFPQYNHFDDAVWSVTMYSGDECEITYQRKFEVSHKSQPGMKPVYGDKPALIVGFKTAKFDMAQINTIETQDYGDSRGSIPSIGIRFVGPTREWHTVDDKPGKAYLKKDPILDKENAISVFAKDSDQILKAFQHLKGLCQTVDDD
jgi:hypothetical protein